MFQMYILNLHSIRVSFSTDFQLNQLFWKENNTDQENSILA